MNIPNEGLPPKSPGDRWTVNVGSIPGEPLMWLDLADTDDAPDDSARAAILEDGTTFTVGLADGETWAGFQTAEAAARMAETLADTGLRFSTIPNILDGQREYDHDGLTVILKIVSDDSPDLSWLGVFGHEARDMPYQLTVDGRGGPVLIGSDGEMRYGPYEEQTEQDAAWVMEDLERLAGYVREDWYMVGCVVEVIKRLANPRKTFPPSATLHRVSLGHASLWGIESDAGEHFREVFAELVPEAIEDARQTISALCGEQTNDQ